MTHATASLAAELVTASPGGGAGRRAGGTRPPLAARRRPVGLAHAAALAASLLLPSGALGADAPYRSRGVTPASVPAFPGAEGFGATARGGRGGAVCEVTNLNDGGLGSLRDCVGRSGPRTVVFRVGGTITLDSAIRITEPFVTIAGQTAPGGGITLRKGNNRAALVEVAARDVVVRFIRLRAGKGGGGDGVTVGEGGRKVILDHLSVSWAVDENVSTVGDGIPGTGDADVLESSDVTIQWSISSEGLNCAFKGECHSKGLLAYGNRFSFHHNLFAHNSARNPQSDGGDIADYVNNVTYNWGLRAARFYPENSCVKVNFVGNYFKPGPNGIPSDPPSTRNKTASEVDLLGRWPRKCPGLRPVFLHGNMGPNRSDDSLAEDLVVEPRYRALVASARWGEAPPVRTTSSPQAFEEVLQHAGASVPTRDAVDERVLRDVRDGTGRIIDDIAQVGGWPQLAAGTPPRDGDGDGMPDPWEAANGLDPLDAADRNGDADGDGYTNLEEYLNGLVAAAFPPSTGGGEPDAWNSVQGSFTAADVAESAITDSNATATASTRSTRRTVRTSTGGGAASSGVAGAAGTTSSIPRVVQPSVAGGRSTVAASTASEPSATRRRTRVDASSAAGTQSSSTAAGTQSSSTTGTRTNAAARSSGTATSESGQRTRRIVTSSGSSADGTRGATNATTAAASTGSRTTGSSAAATPATTPTGATPSAARASSSATGSSTRARTGVDPASGTSSEVAGRDEADVDTGAGASIPTPAPARSSRGAAPSVAAAVDRAPADPAVAGLPAPVDGPSLEPRLVGIMERGALRTALVLPPGASQPTVVRAGDSLGSWSVEGVDGQQVALRSGEQTLVLRLFAAGGQ